MKTPIEMRQSKFDNLVNLCISIKNSVSNGNIPTARESAEMEKCLNELFEEYTCNSVLFTNNTDNILFGINVSPTITDTDIIAIVLTDQPVQLNRYAIEFDLKLFNELDGMEVAAFVVEDIASLFLQNTIDIARNILDRILVSEEDYIEVKQSVNYSQILSFGMKDTMKKVSGLIYKDEDAIGMNEFSQTFELRDMLLDVASKIRSNIMAEEDVTIEPSMGILKWSLMIYKDIEINFRLAEETLTTARAITGSELDKREIDRTIKCIRRASSEVLSESACVMEAVKGFSIFKNLKLNGLRGIEDDLYEYKIRTKNCETEDEAMYILRQINTRINILEDYLASTEVSPAEANRWRSVIDSFRDLRAELAKKKISNKKQYGIFIDYDQYDKLDPPSQDNYY